MTGRFALLAEHGRNSATRLIERPRLTSYVGHKAVENEHLKNFPVKLHSDDATIKRYVEMFIARKPDSFAQLTRLLKQKGDFSEIIIEVGQFLRITVSPKMTTNWRFFQPCENWQP